MGIKNKVENIRLECQEITDFVHFISNPEIEEHINTLPIPPQAKEFFIKLTKTVIMLAKTSVKCDE